MVNEDVRLFAEGVRGWQEFKGVCVTWYSVLCVKC